jgi:hypothetical protein
MPEPTADPPGWVPELNVRTRSSDLTLRGDREYRIGRDPRAAIVLDDERVSWRHALLRLVDGTWVLQDTGSRNGTWVAGRRVGRIEVRGLLVVRFGGPDDGAAVRLQPKPRTPRTREALAAQMLPFILAALRAEGDAVLASPRDALISADATLGRAWLQKIFGRRAEGEPLPPVLAQVIGQAGNAGSRAALSEVIRTALVQNERLAWAAAYALDTRPDLGSLAQPDQPPGPRNRRISGACALTGLAGHGAKDANDLRVAQSRRMPGWQRVPAPHRCHWCQRGIIAAWITPRRGRSRSSGSGTGTGMTSVRCLITSPTMLSSPRR